MLDYIIVPLVGYVGLWLLGSVCFLVYFQIFHVPIDLKHTVGMIKGIPSTLAITTVPVCTFVSFFVTAQIVLPNSLAIVSAVQIGIVSLVATIGLDLLITVMGEKMDIRVFPLNLMYLFAWLVIIPTVMLASRF